MISSGSRSTHAIIDVLSRHISVHGAPRYIRSDNGPEFVSTALMKWALEQRARKQSHDVAGRPQNTEG
jgi:putative transposase